MQATVARYAQTVEVVSRVADRLVGAIEADDGDTGLTGREDAVLCYDAAMNRRGKRREIGAALALAAVLAVAAGCSTNILHGIDERAANDATAALERAGIGAEKVADEGSSGSGASYTIRVAHGDGTRALESAARAGVAPRQATRLHGDLRPAEPHPDAVRGAGALPRRDGGRD